MPRPNILLVLSDDHADHSISAYGSRVNSTPHIDRLAAEGALMEAWRRPAARTRSARPRGPRSSPAPTAM